jgi:hypothetical protein
MSTDVAVQDTAIHFNDALNMETAVSQWLSTLDANKISHGNNRHI